MKEESSREQFKLIFSPTLSRPITAWSVCVNEASSVSEGYRNCNAATWSDVRKVRMWYMKLFDHLTSSSEEVYWCLSLHILVEILYKIKMLSKMFQFHYQNFWNSQTSVSVSLSKILIDRVILLSIKTRRGYNIVSWWCRKHKSGDPRRLK